MIRFEGRGILLDIEGTTSSVRYVYNVLFPYARSRVATFLGENWKTAEVERARELIARDAGCQTFAEFVGSGVSQEEAQNKLLAEVYRLMDGDVKATGLKDLQGLIWREGFLGGALHAHVYADVPHALSAWNVAGKKVCIYSSGSVEAQRLFMAHTIAGNLSRYLQGHFDTTIGPKRAAESYAKIAAEMQLPASQILFVSDVVAELDAARAAGFETALSVRPENALVPPGHGHAVIIAFDQIAVE